MLGVTDTCFLVDWARFGKKDCIKQIFNRLLITEEVLKEIESESTISLVTEWLVDGFLYLVPVSPIDYAEVDRISRIIADLPQIPTEVEKPELICLVLAKKYNCILLTENIGAIRITQWMDEYKEVRVWRAIEVLKEAIKNNILTGKSLDIYKEYQIQTKHTFPKKDIMRLE